MPPRNGRKPGQHLVHHRAERIQVGAVGDLQRLHLLRRHVRRAAGDAFDARDVRVGDQRDAEVDDAHVVRLREHDVRRLDVAVNDAAAVRVVQRLRALVDDLDDVVDRQQVVRLAVRRQRARAVHVLGDDVVAAVLFAGVEDRQDVRMLQHADHVRFRQEHLARDLRAVLVVRLDVVDLDRDVAAVVRVVGKVDDAGAATPDFLDDDVLADFFGSARVALGAALFHQTARGIHVGRCSGPDVEGTAFQIRSLIASRIAAAKMPAIMSSSIIPSPPDRL